MQVPNRTRLMKDTEILQNLLKNLFSHAQWPGTTACSKGCSACCTKSVTISALEGIAIQRHCRQHNIHINIDKNIPNTTRPKQTTNQYVNSFLFRKNNSVEETEWSTDPCMFLKNDVCSIYSIRPIMCRGFISYSDCIQNGFAEVPNHIVSYNIIIQQIIEHISCGMIWGLMDDVLFALGINLNENNLNANQLTKNTLVCQPIKGFMLTKDESLRLCDLLNKIKQLLQNKFCNLQESNTIISCIDQLI